MAYYFDDLYIGQEIESPSRTVTEADIVNFGCLTADFNPLHMDAEFASKTQFGQRIAHGLLLLSFAGGFSAQTGAFTGTTIAFLELSEWKFLKPVFIGDTVHLKITIEELIETSKPDRGIAVRKEQIVNQKGEVVQQGIKKVMLKRKTI